MSKPEKIEIKTESSSKEKKVEEKKGRYYCLDEEGVAIPGTESDTSEGAMLKGTEILKKGR